MPGLISRLTSFIRGQQPTSNATTTTEVPTPPLPSTALAAFQVERDRASIVQLVRRMVDEDPRADGVLKTLARDATRGGFRVAVKRGNGSARANSEAAALIERLGLVELVTDWVELTLRDGDSFLEVSVDANNDIVAVTRKPTLQLHRASDDRDTFPNPTRAYWWADELWMGLDAPRDATWFADWQIIHARWSHDTGSRYGRPLFASSRTAWKRVSEGELDIAVRRKTRAGLKYNHEFPAGTPPDIIEAYKEQNKDALSNPTAAIADFFGTVKINTIEGDARLGEITDVLHHIRTWWVASPVPMSLLGYGQDLNRDVLDEQQEQYERALDALCSWIDKDILQPLIELQWLLKGIWPGSLTYSITRPPRKVPGAAEIEAAGIAVKALADTGAVPEIVLLRILSQLIPGLDADEAYALLKQQRAENPPPAPPGQAPPAPEPNPPEQQ